MDDDVFCEQGKNFTCNFMGISAGRFLTYFVGTETLEQIYSNIKVSEIVLENDILFIKKETEKLKLMLIYSALVKNRRK